MTSIDVIGAGNIGRAITKQVARSDGGCGFYAGDYVAAKARIGAMVERLGFFGIDVGDIESCSRTFQSPGGQLIAHDLVEMG